MRPLMLMTKAGRVCLRFALVRGAEGRQWRKTFKLLLICSGLKADPEGDRLCWFGAGLVLALCWPALVGKAR